MGRRRKRRMSEVQKTIRSERKKKESGKRLKEWVDTSFRKNEHINVLIFSS